MKGLLIGLCAGIFIVVGCAHHGPRPDAAPPMPDLRDQTFLVTVFQRSQFACEDNTTGQIIQFRVEAQDKPERTFMSWTTRDNVRVLTEYAPDTKTATHTWVDVNEDFRADEFWTDPHDIPGYPDVCNVFQGIATRVKR